MKRLVLWMGMLAAACGGARAPAPANITPIEVTPPAAAAPSCGAGAFAFETMRSLADEVGPRLAGSPGDARAVVWALKTFTAAGFSGVRAEPVQAPVWQRVAESASLVEPPMSLAVAALGGSVSTPPGGVSGEVVRFESLDALRRTEVDLTGKIAFIDVVTARTRDGSGYGQAVGARIAGASAAAKRGAMAMLVRSIGTEASRLPHTGAMGYDKDLPRIAAAALSTNDADLLTRTLKRDPHAKLRLSIETRTLPDAATANVLAEVPGVSEELVVLGAHLDSWDLGRGAIDDGAGVGLVMAAAHELLAGPKPARTVRVVLFAAEENSGAGGKAYAAAHAAEAARHFAALEADLGAGAAWGVRVLTASAQSNAARGLFLGIPDVEVLGTDASGGADVGGLRALGVPIVDVMQNAEHYFDVHHTAADVPEVVDRAAMERAACVFAQVTRTLANTDVQLGRVEEARRSKH